MTTTTTPIAPAAVVARRAILIGTKEVTFTPYVIRKVGEVRKVTIDGVVQNVIYNERRNLTYLVLNEVTGRIADELKEDCTYDSFVKGTKVAPKVALKVAPKTTPVAKVQPLVDPAAKAVAAAAKIRRAPKAASQASQAVAA